MSRLFSSCVLAALAVLVILVLVDGVEGESPPIKDVYSAPQDLAIVPPRQIGRVRSRCDLGDQVVSGGLVTLGSRDFNMISSSAVIDGVTGQQSWVFEGTNDGSIDADIRVVARCIRGQHDDDGDEEDDEDEDD